MSKQELEEIKTKLQSSVQARQRLEKTYENQFTLLTRFIIRLSNLCTGSDIELDNRLAKLRSLLSKNTDIENILPLLSDIEILLTQQSGRIELNLKTTQSTLLSAGKQLQKTRSLEDNLRRELRKLVNELAESKPSISHFIPALETLVKLYGQALKAKTESTKSKNIGAFNDSCQMVCNELNSILSNIDLAEEQANKISLIQQSLHSDVNSETIILSCIEVIKIIVDGITEERASAESFLFNLNDTLSTVHTALTCSIDNQHQISRDKQKLGKKMRDNLTLMNEDVATANSLEGLKRQVNKRMTDLINVLSEREILESKEHQALTDHFSTLKVRINQLESECKEYQEKLAEQKFKSLQDPLTELPNRASLNERLDLEYRRWLRYNHNLCLAVLDIDKFKSVNDQYGHSIGDKVLKVIAQTLQKLLRDTDFIARFGGEEFVLLFPESHLTDIERRLNHIRATVSKIPFKIKSDDLKITVSAGVTQFKSDDDTKGAFDRADEALYKAKNLGRNQVIAQV